MATGSKTIDAKTVDSKTIDAKTTGSTTTDSKAADSKEVDSETVVNATGLALVLGITARRVQQLAQDGVISTVSKGKYLLAQAVQSYIDYRTCEKPLGKAEDEKLNAEVKMKKAKAVMLELEAKELQGKMHRSEDVADMTSDLIYTMRGALIALPGRLAPEVAESKTAAEAADIIRNEVFQVMEGLADYKYDPKKYEERVRERNKWDLEEWDDDE